MLADNQEQIVCEYVDTFSCVRKDSDGNAVSLNPDIERFLKRDAVQFAKIKTAVTYLVFDLDDGALLGYFTLAHKPLTIPAQGLSRKIKDKIKRFSSIDENGGAYLVSAFLLAQFGKNYAVDNGERLKGDRLMSVVFDYLTDAQNMVGGTIVYLDCEADAKLIRFYQDQQNFTLFGERISDSDGKRYLQYLKFI